MYIFGTVYVQIRLNNKCLYIEIFKESSQTLFRQFLQKEIVSP